MIGRTSAFEIGWSKDGKFDLLLVESGDGDVERPEVLGGFVADEDDAMSGEECLGYYKFTVPSSYFLPRLSILT